MRKLPRNNLWIAVTVFYLAMHSSALGQGASGRNVKAQDFMNTFGVNVHFNENGYNNVQAIADALNILGFSRVRTSCANPADLSAWKSLGAKASRYFPSGLKADVLIIGYMNALDITFKGQQNLVPQLGNLLENIEGPNEINNHEVGNGTHGPFDTTNQTDIWPTNYATWAKAIATWKQNTPTLAGVSLLAPSIASGDPADYARLPNIARYVTAGNFHFYAGNGRQPSNFGGGNFAPIYDWYHAAATPDKPVALTECGQTTASKPGQAGCDPATQAKYMLNQMFDAAAKGVQRAYIYQLMDDTSDGDPTGNEGTEAHFGLFDYQWRPKPAAQALANVKNLLHDTSTRFTPKVPAYHILGLNNAGAAGSSLTISNSDGSTLLVVWNEPPIWDATANAPIVPPADTVTITWDRSHSYKVYDPLLGLKPIATGKGTQVKVNIVGSPLLIDLIP